MGLFIYPEFKTLFFSLKVQKGQEKVGSRLCFEGCLDGCVHKASCDVNARGRKEKDVWGWPHHSN